MKLNIGCGGKKRSIYKRKEWINVDLVHGDVRANACELPFKNNLFSEIHAIHVLEHIPRKFHDSFHKEMHRVLAPDGVYFVEIPDFVTICNYISTIYATEDITKPKVREQLRIWTLSIYGKNRHVGDIHQWGFYPSLLKEDLERNGFIAEESKDYISGHYRMEPVILMKAEKNGL